MADASFEELVRDALDGLPDWVVPYLEDVARADRGALADPGERDLYGLYEGIPARRRSDRRSPRPRSRSSASRSCATSGAIPPQLARQVRITVVHEIGHHFGIDEDRLRTLGYG